MMKKTAWILLALCLLAGVFSGCAPETSKPVSYDLTALSQEIYDTKAFSDILSPVSTEIAAGFYGFTPEEVTESLVLCSTGATTEEIALFRCADEQAAEKLLTAAKTRAETQSAIYESYAPAEPPKLADAIIEREGSYVFYIVAADYTKVQTALDGK